MTRQPADPASSVAARLAEVRARIAESARAAGRNAEEIALVAVSKGQPAAAIVAAEAAGQRAFGENRVQEAAAKLAGLGPLRDRLELHLIGPLQTNKAAQAVALFDAIESLDRPKLAHALAAAMEKTGRRPRIFVQVNTGEEPQKAGVAPGEAAALVALARDRLELPVEGLMCIPPQDETPALHFALLAELAERLGLGKLSMGMSADYETAIRLGATHVRVGTAVFGARPAPH